MHSESEPKKTIRLLLRDSCEALNRGKLTYLGLPSDTAQDLKVLEPFLENVICIGNVKTELDEAARVVARMPIKSKRFLLREMWKYLSAEYPSEPLVSDVTFLDFYGGGVCSSDPFADEVGGLRAFFAKNARQQNKCFILAWTYNPRDMGKQVYVEIGKELFTNDELNILERTAGFAARSFAIRALLKKSLTEHKMHGKVVQHAVYKRVMGAIIIVFCKGKDPNCACELQDPKMFLEEPIVEYAERQLIPRFIPLPT